MPPTMTRTAAPDRDVPYRVVFFERHAVIDDVAQSPPHRYSGGRYWQAMRADMAGFYEVRCNGPGRTHYRLFCVIDHDAADRDGTPSPVPLLVIIDGDSKANAALFDDKVYNRVRRHGTEYRARNNPRPIRDPSRPDR